MKEITAYVCEFCPRKKARMSKGHTKRHEDICFYNPERKACATCGNFQFEMDVHHTLAFGEDYESAPFRVYYCEADAFNSIQPDGAPSDRYRHDCDKWIPKTEVGN